MNCKEFSDLLDAFAAGSLTGETAAALRAHAEACPGCAEKMQVLQDCKRADGETEVPASFSSAWRRAVREEDTAEKNRQKRRAARSWLAAAATLVFVVGGTLLTRDRAPAFSTAAVRVTEAPVTAAGAEMPRATSLPALKARATSLPALNVAGEAAYESAAYESAAYEDAAYEDAAAPLTAEAFDAEEAEMEEAAAETVLAEKAAAETKQAEAEQAKAAATEAAAPAVPAGGQAEDVPADPATEDGPGTFLREAGRFLEDMAGFLLSALPWLLAAGAVALACRVLIKRRKNKDRSEHRKEE